MSDLRARLVGAASTGEVVSVVYHRGSQPGTVREIVPITISDDDVRARDLAAGIEKIFKLAHMELAGPQTVARAYDPLARLAVEDAQSVEAAVTPHVPELESFGWHVELTVNRVSLHRLFKNGKPRRGADVTIGFDEFTVDMFDDGDGLGQQTETRPSQRPFNVSSTLLPTRTFVQLSAALPIFLDEARKLAPRVSGT